MEWDEIKCCGDEKNSEINNIRIIKKIYKKVIFYYFLKGMIKIKRLCIVKGGGEEYVSGRKGGG